MKILYLTVSVLCVSALMTPALSAEPGTFRGSVNLGYVYSDFEGQTQYDSIDDSDGFSMKTESDKGFLTGGFTVDVTLLNPFAGTELRLNSKFRGVQANSGEVKLSGSDGINEVIDIDSFKSYSNKTSLYLLSEETGLLGIYGEVSHIEGGNDVWGAGIKGKYFGSVAGMDLITELDGGLRDLSDSDRSGWHVSAGVSLFPTAQFMVKGVLGFSGSTQDSTIYLKDEYNTKIDRDRETDVVRFGLELAWKPENYPVVFSLIGSQSDGDTSTKRLYSDDDHHSFRYDSESDSKTTFIGGSISFHFGGAEGELDSLASLKKMGSQ